MLSLLLNLCPKSLFPREKIRFYFKVMFCHYPKCWLGQGICSRRGLERPEKQSWEREDSYKSPAILSLEHMAVPGYMTPLFIWMKTFIALPANLALNIN